MRSNQKVETEAVFIKREMDNEGKVNFLQNSPIDIQCIYSNKFSIGKNTSETLLLILFETLYSYIF